MFIWNSRQELFVDPIQITQYLHSVWHKYPNFWQWINCSFVLIECCTLVAVQVFAAIDAICVITAALRLARPTCDSSFWLVPLTETPQRPPWSTGFCSVDLKADTIKEWKEIVCHLSDKVNIFNVPFLFVAAGIKHRVVCMTFSSLKLFSSSLSVCFCKEYRTPRILRIKNFNRKTCDNNVINSIKCSCQDFSRFRCKKQSRKSERSPTPLASGRCVRATVAITETPVASWGRHAGILW